MDFYKTIFRDEPKEGISIGEDFWDSVDEISPEENEALKAEFSEEEIKKSVFDSYAKSFGPLLKWI
jgi:hypothetical protein